jgi:hypothetical protein
MAFRDSGTGRVAAWHTPKRLGGSLALPEIMQGHLGTINGNGFDQKRLQFASLGPGRFRLFRSKPAAHRVFGDAAGEQEFVEVIGAAGLGADA